MRAPRVNRVLLTGRATRDPELRYHPSGVPVSRISLAFDRWVRDSRGQWEKLANYITAVATGPRALRLQEQLKKGGAVYVEGELQTHHWTGPEGVTRSTIEIRVSHAQVLGVPEAEEPPPGPGEEPDVA